MSLQEIGKLLKETRESKNLDLNTVHDNIKVSIYILKAIEEGNEKILPHPVYTKSFIQSYAKFLGLDWKKIGEEYASIYDLDNKIDKIDKLPTTVKSKNKNKFLLAISLVIVLILFFSLYTLITRNNNNVKTVNEVSNNSSVDNSNLEKNMYIEDNKEKVINLENKKIEANDTEKSLNTTILDKNENIEDKVKEEPEKKGTEIDAKKHSLEIIATDQCWVLAKIDEENKEFYLYPGEKIVINYANFLEIKLGNAGGVRLVLDGKDYPLQAEIGQVKTIQFNNE